MVFGRRDESSGGGAKCRQGGAEQGRGGGSMERRGCACQQAAMPIQEVEEPDNDKSWLF
jgi:hypothetical protein